MKNNEAVIYALGFQRGVEKMWKIMQKVDREHPEYPMPFELDARYRELKGSVDDFIEDHGGVNNEKKQG